MSNTEEQINGKGYNGIISRILQFGQLVTITFLIPWGIWVTGQIYGLRAFESDIASWRISREKSQIATLTDVELARLKVKDELISTMSVKMDAILITLNEVDKKLTRHEAMTTKP